MKRLICLTLILALITLSLTGCRKRAEEAAEETASEGPGYTATDATVQQTENSVPDPLATLTPQQMAAMQADMAEGKADAQAEGELAPPGGDAAQSGGDDLFAPIQIEYQDPAPTAEAIQQDSGVTATSVLNPAAYQYSAVMDDTLDYTFNYPSHWENVPGIYTVCYRERVEKGDFPARISICRKKLVHTPDDIAMMEQLTSYMKMVSERYDSATFQTSTPDKEVRFMGHPALANTYMAFWGNVEVKGYVIGVAIDRTLYVLHFCATYGDYVAMENVMQYMISSVQLKETDKKK